MMKKFLVETISMFRHTYVIECEHEDHAADTVVMDEVEEFSQNHIGENIFSIREITDAEIITLCDRENPYLTSWTDEQKMSRVHRVSY
jgi:hypothetical protein